MFDKFPTGLITVSEVVTFVSFTVLFILLKEAIDYRNSKKIKPIVED